MHTSRFKTDRYVSGNFSYKFTLLSVLKTVQNVDFPYGVKIGWKLPFRTEFVMNQLCQTLQAVSSTLLQSLFQSMPHIVIYFIHAEYLI